MDGFNKKPQFRHDRVLHPTSEFYSDDNIDSSQSFPSHQTISSDDTDADSRFFDDPWTRYYEEEDTWSLRPIAPNLAQFYEDLYAAVDTKEQDVFHEFHIHETYRLPEEKLDVDRDSAKVLVDLFSQFAEKISFPEPEKLLHRLRVEEPVLGVDPTLEMVELLYRNRPELTAKGEKPLPLEVDSGETLHWSKRSLEKFDELKYEIRHGRLGMDKETAEFMRDLMTTTQADETGLEPRFKLESLKISPALLPLSSPRSLPVLSSPLAAIDFTSSPEDLLAQEATNLRKEIMERDEIQGNDLLPIQVDDDAGNLEIHDEDLNEYLTKVAQNGIEIIPQSQEDRIVSPESKLANEMIAYLTNLGEHASDGSFSSPTSHKTKRLRDLRVESPLLPDEYEERPGKKAKVGTLKEELGLGLPDLAAEKIPDSMDDHVETDLTQALMPYAQAALDALAKEQLQEMDTVLRVPMPSLPADPLITPPWQMPTHTDVASSTSNRLPSALPMAERFLLSGDKRWSGVSKVERLLSWTAFPSRLGKIPPEGDFDDGSLARYLADLALDEVTGLEGFIWKPDGYRVLEFDDEELEDLSMQGEYTVEDRRPVDQDIQDAETIIAAPLTGNGQMTSEPVKEVQSVLMAQREEMDFADLLAKRKQSLDDLPKSGTAIQVENGSGQASLVNFLRLQGKTISTPANTSPTIMARKMTQPPVLQATTTTVTRTAADLSLPALQRPDRRFNLVITHAVMADWKLLRALEAHLPNIEYIERDSVMIFQERDGPHKLTRGDIEADLTISASTGIMLTTLQKIKQKPLPGQEKSFHGVKERIGDVAPRYDTLIVLVSEGGNEGNSDKASMAKSSNFEQPLFVQSLDGRDAAALSELVRLNESLPFTEIIVRYIPGGQSALVHWIAAIICQQGWCADDNSPTKNPAAQPTTAIRDDDGNRSDDASFLDIAAADVGQQHIPQTSSTPPPPPPPHPAHTTLLADETFWERFLRSAGMNSFAAQMILGRLKKGPRSYSSAWDGLATFIGMSADQRETAFGDLFVPARVGRENVLARVGRVFDRGGSRNGEGGYWANIGGTR